MAASRRCFPAVVKLLDHIMGNLSTLPPGAEVDINNVAMRLALDMTGAARCIIPACVLACLQAPFQSLSGAPSPAASG